MDGIDSSWVECILRNQERDNEICKISEFDVQSAVPEGQNYASQILRCRMKLVLKSGRRTTRRVIIKRELTGLAGDVIKEHSAFKTESKVYAGVLKYMGDLMDDHEDRNEKVWGQMIAYVPFNTIVFEDLTESNFTIAPNKALGLDVNHSNLVMKSLGRFHAMSKILLNNGLVTEDEMISFYIFHQDSPVVRNLFQGCLDLLGKTVLSHCPNGLKNSNKYLGERLSKESSSVCEKFAQMGKHPDESKFKVISHGDLWTCNMLFKYNDSNQPTHVKFVDFQTVHISSFGWDIAYFLHTSVMPEVRLKHMEEFLQAYHQSLCATLDFYGYDQFVPSLKDVQEELERLEYYGFIMLATIFPITTAESKGALDMDKIATEAPTNPEALSKPKLINDIGQDLKRFAEKGIF